MSSGHRVSQEPSSVTTFPGLCAELLARHTLAPVSRPGAQRRRADWFQLFRSPASPQLHVRPSPYGQEPRSACSGPWTYFLRNRHLYGSSSPRTINETASGTGFRRPTQRQLTKLRYTQFDRVPRAPFQPLLQILLSMPALNGVTYGTSKNIERICSHLYGTSFGVVSLATGCSRPLFEVSPATAYAVS